MANSKQITIIEEKVNSLVDLLDSLYKENQTLKRSLHDVESKLAQSNSQMHSKSSSDKIGTASAVQSSSSREMKSKINHLIQEVDRCIALLSD